MGSKLAEEKLYNPYLKLRQPYFQDLFGNLNDAEKFMKLRKLNDKFDKEEEIGGEGTKQ